MYLALIPPFIEPAAGNTAIQCFTVGSIQIAVSLSINAVIIAGAGARAAFLASRPAWVIWQRRVTGGILGLVAILLAREVPERAR